VGCVLGLEGMLEAVAAGMAGQSADLLHWPDLCRRLPSGRNPGVDFYESVSADICR
jgi:hypothetical protein